MKTAMQEVYYNFNLMSDSDFKAWMLNNDLEKKEREQMDVLEEIIDIIDSENSGLSAEQRLDEIRKLIKTFNTEQK